MLARVRELLAQGRLGEMLRQRHAQAHEVRGDHALYEYATEPKARYLRNTEPPHKAIYDSGSSQTSTAFDAAGLAAINRDSRTQLRLRYASPQTRRTICGSIAARARSCGWST
ncbi:MULTISPECIES: hypothetical protein [unclassified Lysobacter]|uniref:hypothetical protein n=1 Tax=unclassified Lysobacter TaxID=2635362 RepID=UPI0006F74253|nr:MULTISPECIES: hypothetical protein [unclassified Lysobacter]KRA20436.1 hypothetical protein ASD69_03590 [Lysobacter sp. Root604]KRD39453.1 hypothetical protein ASE35_03605 [Lysobacter sp. Root916]KRD79424.1 hypothetical protein ASE43_00385 [Lysobacter sp. Root983]